VAKALEVGNGVRAVLRVARPRAVELDDLVWRADARERPEKQGVDGGEDGGVEADAEREGGDYDRGEGGVLDEQAPGESDVSEHVRSGKGVLFRPYGREGGIDSNCRFAKLKAAKLEALLQTLEALLQTLEALLQTLEALLQTLEALLQTLEARGASQSWKPPS